jgi:hypothetical protein
MNGTLLWVGGVLLWLLLIAPVVTFLWVNWKHRRQEILSGVNSDGDVALKQYFEEFQPDLYKLVKDGKEDVTECFRKYYNGQFGRKHFVIPSVFLFLIVGGLLFLCKLILDPALKSPVPKEPGFLETKAAIVVFAIMGAYLWVVYDQIKKWWDSSLSPEDIYEACFRFALCIPFGYSVSLLAAANAGPVVAFFMGAFPMQTLLSVFRNVFGQKLGLKESQANEKSELLKLQGIDAAIVECLNLEDISTILQLAYADPIRLTIRTNLGYSYLIDCISQALLCIYTGDKQPVWQKYGLRGGFEAMNLYRWQEEENSVKKTESEAIINVLSTDLGIPPAAVGNILWEVSRDPYMQFLYLSWASGKDLATLYKESTGVI